MASGAQISLVSLWELSTPFLWSTLVMGFLQEMSRVGIHSSSTSPFQNIPASGISSPRLRWVLKLSLA